MCDNMDRYNLDDRCIFDKLITHLEFIMEASMIIIKCSNSSSKLGFYFRQIGSSEAIN